MTDDENNDSTGDVALGLQLLEAEGESVSIVDLDAADDCPRGSHAAFVAALAIILRERSDA